MTQLATPLSGDGTGAETRSAPRRRIAGASSLLRIAKIVCMSGEYVCLLRDVSSGGVGLGFLHAIPPETRVILQLSSGLTFPIERVWSGAGRAGYRFAVPVEIADIVEHPGEAGHRPLRLSLRAPARIVDGRAVTEALLRDLSAEGAKIEAAGHFAPGRTVSLALGGRDPVLAEIRWTGQADADGRASLGVRFIDPFAARDLAALALALQPFEASAGADTGEAANRAA